MQQIFKVARREQLQAVAERRLDVEGARNVNMCRVARRLPCEVTHAIRSRRHHRIRHHKRHCHKSCGTRESWGGEGGRALDGAALPTRRNSALKSALRVPLASSSTMRGAVSTRSARKAANSSETSTCHEQASELVTVVALQVVEKLLACTCRASKRPCTSNPHQEGPTLTGSAGSNNSCQRQRDRRHTRSAAVEVWP